jgi:hypothetical protein
MSAISPMLLARFAKLPRMAGEVWQGGLIRLPSWVQGPPGGKPYRPWAALWVSLRTGRIHLDLQPEGGGRDPGLALAALMEFGLNRKLAGCRPSQVEVTDEKTAAYPVYTRVAPADRCANDDKPDVLPDAYAFGSVDEAILCADDLQDAWQTTPGAERWLAAARPRPQPMKRRRR